MGFQMGARRQPRQGWLIGLVGILVGLPGSSPAVAPSTDAQIRSAGQVGCAEYLRKGQLAAGETALRAAIEAQPANGQLRFELGIVKFFQAVEGLGQSFYRAGMRDDFALAGLPLFRLSVPVNPTPKPFTHADWEATLEQFSTRLAACESELAQVPAGDFGVTLDPLEFHLDYDADGKVGPPESLGPLLSQLLSNQPRRRPQGDAGGLPALEIRFDQADVYWLRAYCCLLRAFCEVGLAYDSQLAWDVLAHRVFAGAVVEYPLGDENYGEILDLLAGIHNLRFPLKDPARMEEARGLLLGTIAHSRAMWEAIGVETDNDREWIPSPRQQSAVSPVRMSDEMVETWGAFLDEAEALLKGDVLLPFWRGKNADRGINLRKVFSEPRELDVVLWIHGSQALPYLERGEVTLPDTWSRFQRVFRGQFFGFAVWIN